jgi:hypothetical protein
MRDILRDPGTPPVAESTVGIANTPSAIMVFNMMIHALSLDMSKEHDGKGHETYHPADL